MLKYVGDEKKAEWGKHWIEQGFNGTGGMVGPVECGRREVGEGVLRIWLLMPLLCDNMPVSGPVIYVLIEVLKNHWGCVCNSWFNP